MPQDVSVFQRHGGAFAVRNEARRVIVDPARGGHARAIQIGTREFHFMPFGRRAGASRALVARLPMARCSAMTWAGWMAPAHNGMILTQVFIVQP